MSEPPPNPPNEYQALQGCYEVKETQEGSPEMLKRRQGRGDRATGSQG